MLYYHMIWRENKKYSELHKMHSSLDKVLYWVLFFLFFWGVRGLVVEVFSSMGVPEPFMGKC